MAERASGGVQHVSICTLVLVQQVSTAVLVKQEYLMAERASGGVQHYFHRAPHVVIELCAMLMHEALRPQLKAA